MITKSAEETKSLAREFMDSIKDTPGPVVVELVGDLGAGKTTFMAGVGEFLGVKEPIISPTFLIQKNYEIVGEFPWKRLVHLDAYRIESSDELRGINWEKYSKDSDNVVFIEWPANMKSNLNPTRKIDFNYVSETEREIKF